MLGFVIPTSPDQLRREEGVAVVYEERLGHGGHRNDLDAPPSKPASLVRPVEARSPSWLPDCSVDRQSIAGLLSSLVGGHESSWKHPPSAFPGVPASGPWWAVSRP